VSNWDGDGEDPFGLRDLDEYHPSLGYILTARQRAERDVADLLTFIEAKLAETADSTNAITRSARVMLEERTRKLIPQLLAKVRSHAKAALTIDADSDDFRLAVDKTIEALSDIHAEASLAYTCLAVALAEPDRDETTRAPEPDIILTPVTAAQQQTQAELNKWLSSAFSSPVGLALILKCTPGTGKTEQMLRAAYQQQQRRKRVIIGVATTDMLMGDNPEIVNRLHSLSPTGKVQLAVIAGRREENCDNWAAANAAQQHGYAPGQAVCTKCIYSPANVRTTGMRTCLYYENIIAADLMAKTARRNPMALPPIIVTTHAAILAAQTSAGGRWGSFWAADLYFLDEDCTAAMEPETYLTHAQCGFDGGSNPDLTDATRLAKFLLEVISVAMEEREGARARGFRSLNSERLNSDPIHRRQGSSYGGIDLMKLFKYVLDKLSRTQRMPTLPELLQRGYNSPGFEVERGGLHDCDSLEDIHALRVPPRSLAATGRRVHDELTFMQKVKNAAYHAVAGGPPDSTSAHEIALALDAFTDVEPLAYSVTLHCSVDDHGVESWQFIVRDTTEILDTKAHIVVGDAYAQKEHYELMLRRNVDMIEVTSELHPEVHIIRVLDSHQGIGSIKTGGYVDMLGRVQRYLQNYTKPGDRVLIYGHEWFRRENKIDEFMVRMKGQLGLEGIAFEHWWGGRGKDQYNGWEHVICIGDPVKNLGALRDTANARAYWDAQKLSGKELVHGSKRIELNSNPGVHGAQAMRNAHVRIQLEHERVNQSELTQALHRPRLIYHGTKALVLSSTEMPGDLLLQTAPDTSGDWCRSKIGARARMQETHGDILATKEEAKTIADEILKHRGVWAPPFAHLFVSPKTSMGDAGDPEGGPPEALMDQDRIRDLVSNLNGCSTFAQFSEIMNEFDFGKSLDGSPYFNTLGISRRFPSKADLTQHLDLVQVPADWLQDWLMQESPSAEGRPLRGSPASPDPADILADGSATLPTSEWTLIQRLWNPPADWRKWVPPDALAQRDKLAAVDFVYRALAKDPDVVMLNIGSLARTHPKLFPLEGDLERWRAAPRQRGIYVRADLFYGRSAYALEHLLPLIERYSGTLRNGVLGMARPFELPPPSLSDTMPSF
jgi:hypothetical protein